MYIVKYCILYCVWTISTLHFWIKENGRCQGAPWQLSKQVVEPGKVFQCIKTKSEKK